MLYNIKKNYYNDFLTYKSTAVLDINNLKLEHNNIYGIIGKNGSGKTTLAKCLAETLDSSMRPGEKSFIYLDNIKDILNEKISLKKNLSKFFNKYEIEKFEKNFQKKTNKDKIKTANFIAKLIECSVGKYNICFDEIFVVELISKNYFNLIEIIKKYKSKINFIFISHDLEFLAKICDRVFLINDKKIIKSGSPLEVIDFYRNLKTKKIYQIISKFKIKNYEVLNDDFIYFNIEKKLVNKTLLKDEKLIKNIFIKIELFPKNIEEITIDYFFYKFKKENLIKINRTKLGNNDYLLKVFLTNDLGNKISNIVYYEFKVLKNYLFNNKPQINKSILSLDEKEIIEGVN